MGIYYDEDWQFMSNNFILSVMVKYPKLKDYSASDANAELNKIRDEFHAFENAVSSTTFPNNNYHDYI